MNMAFETRTRNLSVEWQQAGVWHPTACKLDLMCERAVYVDLPNDRTPDVFSVLSRPVTTLRQKKKKKKKKLGKKVASGEAFPV